MLLLAHSAILLGLIVGAAEFSTPVTNSIVVSYRVALAPDRLQGRVQAASTLISFSAASLGPLAIGFLLENTGSTATILAVCGWAATLAVIAILSSALRHPPRRPELPGLAHGVTAAAPELSRARATPRHPSSGRATWQRLCDHQRAMRVALLHPGEMGAAVGAQLVARGHEVLWLPRGRSEATARRARDAGLVAADRLDHVNVILSICPPHAALDVARLRPRRRLGPGRST